MEDLTRIDRHAACALAHVSESAFLKHIHHQKQCKLLVGFPEPATRGRLLWIRQDILDWLRGQRTFVLGRDDSLEQPLPPTPVAVVAQLPPRPRGRPSEKQKQERAAQIAAFRARGTA